MKMFFIPLLLFLSCLQALNPIKSQSHEYIGILCLSTVKSDSYDTLNIMLGVY